MRWKPLACALTVFAAIALSGCESQSVIEIDAHGKVTGYEEITFTKDDYAKIPQLPTDCQNILAAYQPQYAELGKRGLSTPQKTKPIQYPSAVNKVDDEIVSCRFYPSDTDSAARALTQSRKSVVVNGDNTVFHLDKYSAQKLRDLVRQNLQAAPIPANDTKVVVRMPNMVLMAESGDTSLSTMRDTDAVFSLEDLDKEITVVSSTAKAVTPFQSPGKTTNASKKASSGWSHSHTMILITIAIIVLLLIVVTAVVILVPLAIRKTTKTTEENQPK